MKTLSKHKHASVKRNIKHRRKRNSSRSSSSRTYRKKHSHSKRNRKQRGGKTKEDAFRELKHLYYNCDLKSDAIKNAFEQLNFDVKDPESCKKFRQLLRIRDENSIPDMILSKVVCYADIDKIDKIEETTMKHLMLKHDLYTHDSFKNWVNFVKHMNRAVTLASAQSEQPTSMVHAVPVQAQDALPVGWIQKTDDDGRPFYVDPGGESTPQWKRPVLPAGWSEHIDEKSGRTYYWSGFESQWEKPTEEALPKGWKRSGPDHAPIYFNYNIREGPSTDKRPTPETKETKSSSTWDAQLAKLNALLNDDD